MVVAALFTITLKDEESAVRFLTAFERLKAYVVANEPGTLTYELHHCFDGGELVRWKYLVLERYVNRFHFEEVHLKSAPFAELFKLLADLDVVSKELQVAEQQGLPSGPGQPWAGASAAAVHPMLQKGVLIFGGSTEGARSAYTAAAAAFGRCLVAASPQRPVVYGGGTFGVMGAIATAVHEAGGHLVSVIPHALCAYETSGQMIAEWVYYTQTMAERKSVMFAHSDVVVALPGGIGTFDELLEVLTLFQLGAYRPKIGILNVEGFFEPFFDILRHLSGEKFLREDVLSFFVVGATPEELMEKLDKFELPERSANKLMWLARF